MDLKQPLSFSEQVKKLKEHHVIIDDDVTAEEVLRRVNYYKLTGYTLQFRQSSDTSDLAGEHNFEEICQLYLFDQELRSLLRKYLEIVEIYSKTQIANAFALEKRTTPPYDQHYDERNYYNKDGFRHIMVNFKREQGYYSDSLIVKHHVESYGGKMPLWVMVELMSFSSVSKLYNAMYHTSKQIIAKRFSIGEKTLANHLHCLSVLRNKCSHAARLMNINYYPPAKLSSKFLRDNPSVNNASLFAYLCVLKWRLPTNGDKIALRKELFDLFDKYLGFIDLSLMGFPLNYKNIF
ncbi:MAG: Abi family protein [Eubacterium sp.]|nr:Abi family protein [Eubacterium sp.]